MVICRGGDILLGYIIIILLYITLLINVSSCVAKDPLDLLNEEGYLLKVQGTS